MHFHSLTPYLGIISLLLCISTAKPIQQAGHTKITRVPHQTYPKNGPKALSKAYHKWGWTLPPGVADSLSSHRTVETNNKASTDGNTPNAPTGTTPSPNQAKGSGTGRVPATAANQGSEYLCPVKIGSQTLHMNIDTGSSDLWVFSTALETHERGSHTLYQPPSGHHIKGANFNVSYGDDTSLTGSVAFDDVSIGGINVKAQAVELPTEFSAGIIDDPSDGIVGLGFGGMNSVCSQIGTADNSPSTSASSDNSAKSGGKITNNHNCPDGYEPNPRPTWFENAIPALSAGVFTANLQLGSDGYYEFGSIDHAVYKGDDVHYVPVDNSKGYWGFSVSSYKTGNGNGNGKGLQSFPNSEAIADSGSSLLMLEPEVVKAYYAEVEGATEGKEGWIFPCHGQLPDFVFTFANAGDVGGDGAYEVVVEGRAINYAVTNDGLACYGGIQSNDGQGPQVFGDIMFKSQFVVFDYDNLKLGFAPHA